MKDIAWVTQRSFFEKPSKYAKTRISYGGTPKGRAKEHRPLDSRRPLHIVMKSSVAKGELSLLKKEEHVLRLLKKWARACGVIIHRVENMGNHLHLLVSFQNRTGLQKFLRTISGLIARLITKAQRGHPFGKRFWDSTVFTRIITGFRDRATMDKYLNKNEVERSSGPAMREAMELYEEVTRKARKRGVPREVIYQELAQVYFG